MMVSHESIFTRFGKYFSADANKQHATLPFKDHPQFPLMTDIVSRKDQHHLLLFTDFPKKMQVFFLEALAQHLHPKKIANATPKIIYLDIANLCNTINKEQIIDDFKALYEKNDFVILVLNQVEPLLQQATENHPLYESLVFFLTQEKSRLVILLPAKEYKNPRLEPLKDQFDLLRVNSSLPSETLAILKRHRTELEHFHRVFICSCSMFTPGKPNRIKVFRGCFCDGDRLCILCHGFIIRSFSRLSMFAIIILIESIRDNFVTA